MSSESDEDFDDSCEISRNGDIHHAVLQNMKMRFMKNKIYTFSGKLLIAINPLQPLPLYSNEVIESYKAKTNHMLQPHIFCVATEALCALKQRKQSQCIVVTGLSGSGKSVTANHLIEFLYENEGKMTAHIGIMLDAFGNCTTPQNDNSSRFVKLLQFEYSPEYKVLKLNISYQLFEKTRLCMNDNTIGDNFNIFYMLLNAPMDLKSKFNIASEKFAILPPKGMRNSLKYSFNELETALNGLGSDISEMRESIYAILAAILHLGNVKFKTDHLGFAQINDGSHSALESAANLLAIDEKHLKCVLLERKMVVGADTVSVRFNETLAVSTRDSTAKLIYCELFRFLIDKINGATSELQQYIAILDIPGFECFEMGQNSFEQICINFVNEKIRNFSTNRLIKAELDWYKSENLDIPQIDFLDNQNIIDLLEDKTEGIFSLLEDESKKRVPSSINFMKMIASTCIKKSSFTLPKLKKSPVEPQCFVIHHFSQDVFYSSENFVEKNTESVSTDVHKIVEACLEGFGIKEIQKINRLKSTTAIMKKDLSILIDTLKTNDSHFIHCVKPNNDKLPNKFEDGMVSTQLNTVGVAPIVNLMRNENFVNMFKEMNTDETKQIAQEISDKFYMRQRNSFWIKIRVLGIMLVGLKKKRNINSYPEIPYSEEVVAENVQEIKVKEEEIMDRQCTENLIESTKMQKIKRIRTTITEKRPTHSSRYDAIDHEIAKDHT
ncbi:myosin heavy chain 95F-like, partial [Contarinia nasturtii]|uniref:myosin heavy chain 95F-like n=1 Tax=Contarinia nasturtii TaxID=265458 RepID=UPI0012D3A7A0